MERELTIKDHSQVAFNIIVHAGNARGLVNDAIKAAEEGDFLKAESDLNASEEEICLAHQEQTKMIQIEARGTDVHLTMLLTHAQDTLMIAMSEERMGKYIINLYKTLQNKMSAQ
jgi:PTS system cellobiose-specific IIA component